MKTNIKKLQNLYSWNQFYQARQQKDNMRRCQIQINKLKRELNTLKTQKK